MPAVAVFWVDAEDHDWDEVKSCGVLDGDHAPRSVSIGDVPGAHAGPVARVRLNEAITTALSELQSALPATEFTPALLDDLRRCYEPGAGMADAFSRWLERVLGPRGLVVFDSSDPAAKPLVAGVFAREIEHAGETARLAAEAGAALAARGYHAQVTPQRRQSGAVSHERGARADQGHGWRLPGRRRSTQSKAALLERARAQSRRVQPERAVATDRAGHDLPDRLLRRRARASWPIWVSFAACTTPSACRCRSFSSAPRRPSSTPMRCGSCRSTMSQLEALRAQDEAALNELLIAQLPASVEVAIQAAGDTIEQRMDALAREVPRIDATLEGATRSTLSRMQDDLKKLHAKIVQAAKRKDETLRRQFHHAQAQAFPGGHPQEREIGFVTFLNKYGPGLVDRLVEALPAEMGTHWVITI